MVLVVVQGMTVKLRPACAFGRVGEQVEIKKIRLKDCILYII